MVQRTCSWWFLSAVVAQGAKAVSFVDLLADCGEAAQDKELLCDPRGTAESRALKQDEDRLRIGALAGFGAPVAGVVDALGSAEEHEQESLLRVHAVLGLIEDDGLRTVEDGVGDFGVAVRREAVHEDGVGLRVGHERFVDLVGLEDGGALGGFMLEAHAGADVGVDGVGAGDGLDGVVQQGDAAAGRLGDLDGLVDDLEFGAEAFGRWQRCSARRVARR